MKLGLGLGLSHFGAHVKAFDPTGAPGLLLWLDSGVGVTQVAGSASAWADQSGNGRNYVAGTNPTYHANGGPNNRPYLTFTGAAYFHYDTFPAMTFPEMFFVAQSNGVIAQQDLMLFGGGARLITYDIGSNAGIYNGSTVTGPALDANPHIWDAIYNGAASSISLDGGTPTVGNPGSTATGSGISYLGSSAGSVEWDGKLCEVIVYSANLSSSDRAKVINYLKTKYAIS